MSSTDVITRFEQIQYVGLPLPPSLDCNEVLYSLNLLLDLLCSNMGKLHDHHRSFIDLLCSLCRLVKHPPLYIKVLHYMEQWMKAEEELLPLDDLKRLVTEIPCISSFPESVTYIEMVQSYWKFIYAACLRYPHWLHLSEESLVISESSRWIAEILRVEVIRGVMTVSPETHHLFRPLLYKLLPDGLFARLKYIFCDLMGDETRYQGRSIHNRQWLPLLVDLLITSFVKEEPMRLAEPMLQFPALPIGFDDLATPNPTLVEVISLVKQRNSMGIEEMKKNLIELAYGDIRLAFRYVCFTRFIVVCGLICSRWHGNPSLCLSR